MRSIPRNKAVPIGEYLGSINGREKAPETPAQTEAPPDSAQAAKPSENASGESTEHLFDLPETGFRLSEEGEPVSLKEALDQADADEEAAKALRDCL
jgi:protein-disulfide isomerase